MAKKINKRIWIVLGVIAFLFIVSANPSNDKKTGFGCTSEERQCIPDCSCADNICTDSTCSDGCGGTCQGTQLCGSLTEEELCTEQGGKWMIYPSTSCCCPKDCLSMTGQEQAQNMELCSCCLID